MCQRDRLAVVAADHPAHRDAAKVVHARQHGVENGAADVFEVAIDALRTAGLLDVPAFQTRDVTQAHIFDEGVMLAWTAVYRDPHAHWELYELAEKLVDLEDYFRRWRFNHVTTVERVIGFKRGTGGTGGVSYLRRMLEVELFPELWRLRTEL